MDSTISCLLLVLTSEIGHLLTDAQSDIEKVVTCKTKECRAKMCTNQLRLKPGTIEMHQCLCSFDCTHEPDWQCSTDGHSFLNPCVVRSRECLLNQAITIAHAGQCKHSHRGSCAGIYCSLGTRCTIVSEDQPPMCSCSISCPLVSKQAAVCGSDGELYANECYMKALACRLNRTVTVIRYERCREKAKPRPCDQLTCVDVCVETGPDRASCVCTQQCLSNIKPVCGSDHRTYDNECKLELASCEAGASNPITVHSDGPCPEPDGVCREAPCLQFGGTCIVRAGKPVCLCDDRCRNVNNPMCGSNRVTYNSKCQLDLAACQANKLIAVAHLGPCKDDPCLGVRCGLGRKCFNVNGARQCQCYNDCDGESNATVCASDGQSYAGECAMSYAACKNETNVTVSYAGTCDPCRGVTCSDDKYCEATADGKKVACVCIPHRLCPRDQQLVCGSDGQTYANECVLKAKACVRNASVMVRSAGKCPKDPCRLAGLDCDFYQVCDLNADSSSPRCTCPEFDCPAQPDLVCGSDRRTYRSRCSLRRKSCAKKSKIVEVKNGRC